MNRQLLVVVILPTYNESGNIIRILDAISQQQKKLKKILLQILIVDDRSPDGTAALVRQYAAKHSNIYLLTGDKRGLGVAYIRGFTYALKKLHADIVFEMDADFSHNPNDIPRFIKQIQSGSDFVIGSRYIKGGSIPQDWSYWRVLNSKIGNIFARRIAGMMNIYDCTSGFRAINTNVFKNLNLSRLNAAGYAFQINLLYEIIKSGYKVTEIPIHFSNRQVGNSKLQIYDIIEFFKNTFSIRIMKIREKLKSEKKDFSFVTEKQTI